MQVDPVRGNPTMTDNTLFAAPGDRDALEQGGELTPRFGADGLVVCVTQDADSGEVMMVAHMNAEALAKTIETGVAHYWSRSRGAFASVTADASPAPSPFTQSSISSASWLTMCNILTQWAAWVPGPDHERALCDAAQVTPGAPRSARSS